MKTLIRSTFVSLFSILVALGLFGGCGGGTGPGTLAIMGTGEDTYEVLNQAGNKVASGRTNTQITVPAGNYMVVINGAGKSIRVSQGATSTASLGVAVVEGAGDGVYEIHDPTGRKMLSSRPINKGMELQPGKYVAMLYGAGVRVVVKEREKAVIKAGTLAVTGSKHTFYTVFDSTGTQKLDFRSGSRTIDLLPGTYQVQAGGKMLKAEIKAGETTTLQLAAAP